MSDLLVSTLLALGAVAWTEFREWFPWFAKRMIALAVTALPKEDRARMREELSAEVAVIPGKLSPFFFACDICWGFWRPVLTAKLDMSASRCAIRAADIVLSFSLLVLASPLMLSCMLAIRLSGRGPLIFRAKVVGRHNKEFYWLTYRIWDLETREISRLGAFLFRTGISRLPNLLRVLVGDMSLVGPPPRQAADRSDQFVELRPGFVWFPSHAIDDARGFGRSTFETTKLYFKLLYGGVVSLLFLTDNRR